MKCDRSCERWATGKNGKRMSLPRAYPTDRLCCALALLQSQSHKARDTTLRVIAAHHGEKYAAMVRDRFAALNVGGEQ